MAGINQLQKIKGRSTKLTAMANVITSVAQPGSLVYEVFQKPLLDDPQIQSLPFDFMFTKFLTNDLYFNTQLDKISVKKVACGWTFNGGASFTKKTVQPVEIAAAVEQCYKPLTNTIFAQGLPDGWERGELSPEVIDFMTTQRSYAFNRDLLTILFLGDTANASAYYSIADGIYKKVAAGYANGDGTVRYAADIDAADLSAANFFATMNGIWNARTRFMRSMPKTDLAWIWTEAVYDKYIAYLQSATQDTAGLIQKDAVEAGLEPTRFNGVPIVVVPIVDERLEADFVAASPATADDPYRIILTAPSNHKVLMDGDGMTKELPWYEKKDDKYYIAGSCLYAYEYGYGELNVYAGF